MASAPSPSGVVSSGAWAQRPSGVPAAVPPPGIPLAFLGASGLGLVAMGVAWVLTAGAASRDLTADPVVAAVHLGVLATLATGVLGAMHQFVPVITARPIRSVRTAATSLIVWVVGAWALPLGIGTGSPATTAVGGAALGVAVALVTWNLAPSLRVRGKGSSVTALRWSLAGAIATTLVGVAFVGDRRAAWFPLSGHVDLAMGVVGMFAWLGTAYIGVAAKLWPMFMLAHLERPDRAGATAVWAMPIGAIVLATGLAIRRDLVAEVGALVLAVAIVAHLRSLVAHVAHRRRARDLHLVYVLTSAGLLVAGSLLGAAGTIAVRMRVDAGPGLVAAAMVAFGGWLLVALVGHAHKVVPFIGWSLLRARGVRTGPSGRPLAFADLIDARWAALGYGQVTAGVVALASGLATRSVGLLVTAGALLAASGVTVTLNLVVHPWRVARSAPAADVP